MIKAQASAKHSTKEVRTIYSKVNTADQSLPLEVTKNQHIQVTHKKFIMLKALEINECFFLNLFTVYGYKVSKYLIQI